MTAFADAMLATKEEDIRVLLGACNRYKLAQTVARVLNWLGKLVGWLVGWLVSSEFPVKFRVRNSELY